MKTRNFLVLLLLLSIVGSSLRAQPTSDSRMDSLLTVLRTNPHDTVKIDSYFLLYKTLFMEDTVRTMEYLRKAISLSEKIDDKRRSSMAHIKLAYFYLYKGKTSEALDALAKAEKQLKYFRDTSVEADFFRYRGITYNFRNTYDLAVNDLLKACSLYETLDDSAAIAHCYINIGISNMDLENYDKALEYYQKSLTIYQKMGDEQRAGHALGNLGIIYKRKNDYERALDFYQQSLAINEKHGFKMDARMDLNNIGVLYEELGDYKKALEFHNEAKEIADSLALPLYILTSKYNLARVAFKLGNNENAIAAFDEILTAAKELNYKEIIKDTYDVLSDVYQKTGELQLALDSRKEYELWKDSLLNENHLNQVKELELKYETEKKEKQIALLAQEKELQAKETQRQTTLKQASLGGLFAVLLLAGLLIYTLRQRIKTQKFVAAKNEEVKSARFQQQLSELEMKALRAQMNPHFIFNCINSINRMVLNGKGDGASRYLTKFAKLIRLMLENSENPTVSLEDELVMLEAYLQLESLRFKEKIRYEIVVDDTIDRETTCLPAMVLQPFIENAIWHGLMSKQGDGLIKITIQEEEDVLKCIIEDNGVGRERALALAESQVTKKKSMGLQITEERLKLLSKERLKELIRITDLKDSMNHALGTRVDVLIPIS